MSHIANMIREHGNGFINNYPDPPITPLTILESVMEQRKYPEYLRQTLLNTNQYKQVIRTTSSCYIIINHEINQRIGCMYASSSVLMGAVEHFPSLGPTTEELQLQNLLHFNAEAIRKFIDWYRPLIEVGQWVSKASTILRLASEHRKINRKSLIPTPLSAVAYYWRDLRHFIDVRPMKPSPKTREIFKERVGIEIEDCFSREFLANSERILPMLMMHQRAGSFITRRDAMTEYELHMPS